MSAGTFIIKKALRAIGAYSIAAPEDTDAISEGMDTLNGMIQSWESVGIILGTTMLAVPGDELNEPADATNAIIANLAILMSPNYSSGARSVVSPQLRVNARTLYLDVRMLYLKRAVSPRRIVSSTLPMGEGNNQGNYCNQPYFDESQELGK